MNTRLDTLFHAFDGAADAPEWIHLLPAGTFTGADGRGPFTVEDPDALIAASMRPGKLPVDQDHATDLAAPQGGPAPARGWIVAMERRDDGIWGKVEWTATGRALVAEKAYRGISPVFVAQKDGGRVAQILRASLTNNPNLTLTHLHHSTRSQTMDLAASLRSALKLADAADDKAILDAVTALNARTADPDALVKRLADAAGVTATSADALVTELQSVAAKAKGAGNADELAGKVVSLQSQLDAMKQSAAKAAAERYVDEAIKAGKPIKPLRDHYVTRHMADAASVEKEIGAMISLNAGGVVPSDLRSASGEGDLNSVQLAAKAEKYAKEHGVSHHEAVRAIAGKA